MKIISWNVNWIRAIVKKWFKEFLEQYDPDILCIQETKAFESQFLKEVWPIWGYKYVWHAWTRKGYSWTVIFYKENIKVLDTKNYFWEIEHFHTDGRITEITLKDFVLINWYFPNGWTRTDGTKMLSYKLDFYDYLINYANDIVKTWKNVIITWDFNIAHTKIDIARPKENKNSIWFLPEERAKFTELLENNYIDVFRYFYPDKKDIYSWWSYRTWARVRNVWRRIDYFIVNKSFIEKIENIQYLTDVIWSDHCPIMLRLEE